MEGKTITVNHIEVHPAAERFPMLPDDQLAAMAEDIAANGLKHPVVLAVDGRVADGRNRIAACRLVSVEPTFVTRDDLIDDDAVEDYVLSVNVETRSLTNGQKAMFRAKNLARQGKRKNGRWERGSVDNGLSSIIDAGWIKAMKQAGLVIDVADRATTLGPDFAVYVAQPDEVEAGSLTLDAAHRIAQDFDGKAAMAEMAVWAPFTKAAAELDQLSLDAATSTELPVVDAPLSKQHRNQLEETAKRFAAVASAIRTYAKDAK
jgi:hypothetical protein